MHVIQQGRIAPELARQRRSNSGGQSCGRVERIRMHVGKFYTKEQLHKGCTHKASCESIGEKSHDHNDNSECPPYSSSNVQGLISCAPPRLQSREMQSRGGGGGGGARISIMYSYTLFRKAGREIWVTNPHLHICIRVCFIVVTKSPNTMFGSSLLCADKSFNTCIYDGVSFVRSNFL